MPSNFPPPANKLFERARSAPPSAAPSPADNISGTLIYLFSDNNVRGPYTGSELRDMLAHREIPPDILVCIEGGTEWVRLDVFLGSHSTSSAPISTPQKISIPSSYKTIANRGRDDEHPTQSTKGKLPANSTPSDEIANKNMLYGALWCLGGTAATAIGYLNASGPQGGHYTLFWGAIIFGALQFIKGFSQHCRK